MQRLQSILFCPCAIFAFCVSKKIVAYLIFHNTKKLEFVFSFGTPYDESYLLKTCTAVPLSEVFIATSEDFAD